MPNQENIYKAFFSYMRQNDQHDKGKLSTLRKLIEAEVWAQTAVNFKLFQDQEDIAWGENWKERIKEVLDSSRFLIAIITPGYLKSETCQFEFEYFIHKKKELGEDDLILPLLYIETGELHKPHNFLTAEIAKREWLDWRDLRFASFDSVKAKRKIESLAMRISDLIARERDIDIHKNSISIPNSVITEWDEEWQPSFETAEIPKLPASLYVPLAQEEAPTHPPKQITVTLLSTGDFEHDRRRIKTGYGTLISFHGRDRFSFHVFEHGKGHLIDFPYDSTRIDVELLSRLKKLLGGESWQIEEIKFQ